MSFNVFANFKVLQTAHFCNFLHSFSNAFKILHIDKNNKYQLTVVNSNVLKM